MLIDRIVHGLTAAGEGAASDRSATAGAHDVVFTGTNDEIDRYFHQRGWSDGLPIVPPTKERITAFLQRTPRKPDEEIAVLPTANLRATPWNIAANGVMAGCRPEHMPLLIAVVEALGDEHSGLNMIGSSSGIVPFMLVNGPLAKTLGLESGAQLVNRGTNPVLGRALGFIIRNIAGFRPGANYMGSFGYPLAFAVAENEDESPWEPFHVEHGFAREDSTVTFGVTNNWGPSPAAAATAEVSGAEAVIQLISREIPKKSRLYNFPARGPDAEHAMITVLMSPSVAKTLADAGFTKHSLKQHLYERTLITLRDFAWNLTHVSIMQTTLAERVASGVYPEEFLGAPDDPVRLLSSPDILHIVVCGDPHRNRLMVMEGGHTRPTLRRITTD
ncbi:MAG TPA: hypothetical protein VED01_24230 [Burkholderiales bacterium]|nr:hypothetical protein [Burkholderiales bacterium]